MAHRDPRQEVIAKLSRFLTPSAKVQIGVDTYKPIGIDSRALGETVEGFHVLRERTIPGIPGRMMLAAINETRAPGQLLICYLEQDAQGLWRYSGGASTALLQGAQNGADEASEPTPSSSLSDEKGHFIPSWQSRPPHVNLGGGGWPDHFHVGGYVVTNGADIARIRLLSANGTVIEDMVVNGIVLFFTDQAVEIPLLAELYDRQGELVADHNVFGSYSRFQG